MRKSLLLLITLLTTSFAMAEDVIQVMPFNANIGTTSWTNIPVNMENSNTYTAFEFTIYVPEGMTLYTGKTLYLSERFEYYDEDEGENIKTHTMEITDKGIVSGKGHGYYITCYDTDFHTISGNSGKIFELRYKTTADMQPGVYPIRIEGTVLGINGNTGIYPENSVSFVTIKNTEGNVPTNGMLDLGDNLIPSFVQDQLPANNVIINGVCANLVLTDGNDLTIPSNFTATNATYTREMSNTWGTVCLPYAVNSNTEVAYYSITGVNNGVLMLEEYETLPANTPALVQKISGSSVTCSATNVSVVAGGDLSGSGAVTMHGSYADNTQITASNAYYIKDNKFWLNNNHFIIDAFRAYFTYDAVGGGKPSVLSIDGLPTAIEMLTNSKDVIGVWDANGMMRKHIDKGMNIVKMADGKSVKVFVK